VKLLFDENLSIRLVALLGDVFPDSIHVEQALGRGRTDVDVWNHAVTGGYAIVSKDNDFRQRAFVSGPPPKVVWLAVRNAGTAEIADLLRSKATELIRFDAAAEESLLAIESQTAR
jgi:predicted nuclease of predicted toxin-antitoxin system